MLQYQTIYPSTLQLLKELQSLELLKECRLVGGTALALQLGHRNSVVVGGPASPVASLRYSDYEILVAFGPYFLTLIVSNDNLSHVMGRFLN